MLRQRLISFCGSDLSQMRTHVATRLLALILSLRFVARIQTSLNSCDRSQRQNSVAATIIFTCHTRRFVAETCRGDVSHRVSRPLRNSRQHDASFELFPDWTTQLQSLSGFSTSLRPCIQSRWAHICNKQLVNQMLHLSKQWMFQKFHSWWSLSLFAFKAPQ